MRAIWLATLCAAAFLAAAPAGAVPRQPDEVLTTIDVLVLYTTGAAQRLPGAALEAQMADAVVRANRSLSRSAVRAHWRVVALKPVPVSTPEEPSAAYRQLQHGYRGAIDEWRNLYRSDLVSLIVAGASRGYAGWASQPITPTAPSQAGLGTSDDAWSALAADQLQNSVVAHEWGHNLGLSHDWTTDPRVNPRYPDNHAYVAPDGSFATLMADPDACPETCELLERYSNPRQSHRGQALGIPRTDSAQPSDEARVLNQTAPIVAAYR